MEFLDYAPLEFKRTVRAGLPEAADEDPDYSDVLWRTPRPVNPLRPPFAGTRRDLWLPIPLKRCDFGLETGRDLAKIG
jgi:hypothetical protein